MKNGLWVVGCGLWALVLAGCGKPALPVYGQVPGFVLTADDGREFRSDTLKGRVWVADFMFTNCLGPCPRMTSEMHRLEQQTRDVSGVRFVSFTVDPENDTPQVMAAYAQRFHADRARWKFLTGAQKELDRIGRHALKLNDVDGSLIHSTRFVLVDQKGNIRGYYDSADTGDLARLANDIRRVVKESS